jgi:regulator of sirC expression with transglutaminase-like and TPR domain
MLFANAVSGEDGQINLALASLLFALDRYPELDLSVQLGRLDELAEGARGYVPPAPDAEAALGGLARYLHARQGFDGSVDAYASPAGSFLNEALERRTGLPITLSVIYLEVGWRLGLPVEGVGLPGHFIIKYTRGGTDPLQDVFCDPFNAGRLLSAEDCRELLEGRVGARFALRREFLEAATRRAILYRMLNNLKSAHLRSHEPELALWATDRMLIVAPQSASDMRDRGLLHYAVENYRQAMSDLLSYLTMQPGAQDAHIILQQIVPAAHRSGMLN